MTRELPPLRFAHLSAGFPSFEDDTRRTIEKCTGNSGTAASHLISCCDPRVAEDLEILCSNWIAVSCSTSAMSVSVLLRLGKSLENYDQTK